MDANIFNSQFLLLGSYHKHVEEINAILKLIISAECLVFHCDNDKYDSIESIPDHLYHILFVFDSNKVLAVIDSNHP